MIYVDTSVALAQLLAEDRRPPKDLWAKPLVTSRLLQYELWASLNARDLARTHGDAARLLLARFDFVELARAVLARAVDPFPTPVRTLDAMHLATVAFLSERGLDVVVATYDGRMRHAAAAMGLTVHDLEK